MANPLPPPDLFSHPYTYIYQAWDSLSGVPMAVGALILLTTLGTWALFYFLHQRQLSDLRERVQLRDDQIAELRGQITAAPSSNETFVIEADGYEFSWAKQSRESVPIYPEIPKPSGVIPRVRITAIVTAIPKRDLHAVELDIPSKKPFPQLPGSWEPRPVGRYELSRFFLYFDVPLAPGTYSAKLIAYSGDVKKASAPFQLTVPR